MTPRCRTVLTACVWMLLATGAQAQAGGKPAAAEAPKALVGTYTTYNEHGFGFQLTLNADGTSLMVEPNMDFDDPKAKDVRYQGTWKQQGDHITVQQRLNKNKQMQLVYVARPSLAYADPTREPSCRGTFGLQAVRVPDGEALDDYFVWPLKAVKAGKAPCAK